MPYIAKGLRPGLDDSLDALVTIIREKTGDKREKFFGRLGYVALKTQGQLFPIRYWAIADVSGVFNNVADEMCRRFSIERAPYDGNVCISDQSLDEKIKNLVEAIRSEAGRNLSIIQHLPPNLREITVAQVQKGILNYSLTTLALRIAQKIFEETGFNLGLLRQIPTVFKRIYNEYYSGTAGPYEDRQIANPENGDLPEYRLLLLMQGGRTEQST